MTLLLLAIPIFFVVYSALEGLGAFRKKSAFEGSGPTSGRRPALHLGAKLGFNKMFLQNKGFRERLELLVIRSGHLFGWTAEDLLFIKELGVLLALFFLWQYEVTNPGIWLAGAVLGFLLPDLYMKGKIASRKAAIHRQLPGFVDLAALTLESGLDLVSAIERILEKMRASPLAEELQMFLQETRLGTPRKEALEHLAFRVDLTDLRSLTSIIIQSEELGTSLATVLRNYAEDMRSRRILLAEELAGKAPVKLLFPMMVFFFPIVFVIIFGPMALHLMGSLK